jgi:hypothetical protein
MIRIALVAILCSCIYSTAASADEGEWRPDDEFAQFNVSCSRTYRCVPKTDIISGPNIRFTARQQVGGVCSAGAGDASGCNFCLTNPPRMKCEYTVK